MARVKIHHPLQGVDVVRVAYLPTKPLVITSYVPGTENGSKILSCSSNRISGVIPLAPRSKFANKEVPPAVAPPTLDPVEEVLGYSVSIAFSTTDILTPCFIHSLPLLVSTSPAAALLP